MAKNHHIDPTDSTRWDGKVSKTGDTMSGGLNVQASIWAKAVVVQNSAAEQGYDAATGEIKGGLLIGNDVWLMDINQPNIVGLVGNFNRRMSDIWCRRADNWSWVWHDRQGATAFQANNGYCKLPNGLILQWGRINVPAGATGVSITYPVAFTTLYQAFAQPCIAINETPNTSVGVEMTSVSQMRLRSSVTRNVCWLAMGYIQPDRPVSQNSTHPGTLFPTT